MKQHLKPLTSLRFFAAFVVLMCHFRYAHEGQLPAWLWNFAEHGYVGVNLFFVLSGFVIAYNYSDRLAEKAVGYREFMLARFARIWPAFAFALLLAFPVYVLRSEEAMQKLPLLIPTHLTLTHNFFPNLGEAWLFPSWTIGTEWGFYLLFPLFGAAVTRLSPKRLWALLGFSALLCFALPTLYVMGALDGVNLGAVPGRENPEDAFLGRVLRWYPFFRLPEFLIGVCVCRLFVTQPQIDRDRWARIMGPVAAFALGIVVFLMSTQTAPQMLMNQALLTLPFAAILLYLAYDSGPVARWLSVPALVLLGEASYSLYLIHPVVKQSVLMVGQRVGFSDSSLFLTALMFPISIAVSLLMFKYIEAPSRRWIVGRYGRKQRPPAKPAEDVDAEADRVPAASGA